MGFLTIDESKCKKDGICVNECPSAIIRLESKVSYPGVAAGDEKACLVCGHCVAVCPHGALSHFHIPIEGCPPVRNELLIKQEQAVQFLRSRRSVRRFQNKSVEKEKILRLIELARYAPTSGNTQSVRWLVFTDKDQIKEFSRLKTSNNKLEIKKSTPLL